MTTATASAPTTRPLSSPINPGTGAPWRCATHEPHTCTEAASVVVGAYPCCDAGATAEIATQVADRARRDRWAAAHAAELEAEARAEMALEEPGVVMGARSDRLAEYSVVPPVERFHELCGKVHSDEVGACDLEPF